MSIIGNILWFLLGGFLLGMAYIIMGLLFCITIIGIPFGLQLMKIGIYTFCPFGRTTEMGGNVGVFSVIFNVIWIVCGWIEIAVMHCILGALLCLTIIGIPFGKQHFKIAKLSMMPFGQTSK